MSTDYRPTAWIMPMPRKMASDILARMPELPEPIPEITAAELISLGTQNEEEAHRYLKECARMYGLHVHECWTCFRVTAVHQSCDNPNITGYCSCCLNA